MCKTEFCYKCGAKWRTCRCLELDQGPDYDEYEAYLEEQMVLDEYEEFLEPGLGGFQLDTPDYPHYHNEAPGDFQGWARNATIDDLARWAERMAECDRCRRSAEQREEYERFLARRTQVQNYLAIERGNLCMAIAINSVTAARRRRCEDQARHGDAGPENVPQPVSKVLSISNFSGQPQKFAAPPFCSRKLCRETFSTAHSTYCEEALLTRSSTLGLDERLAPRSWERYRKTTLW